MEGVADDGQRGTDLTITDSAGLTWTSRAATTGSPAWSYGIRVWTAPVTTGVSMTVTVDCGAFTVYAYRIEAYDFTDYDTATPIGGTIVGTDPDGDGALALTLSAAPASSSIVMAHLATILNDADGTATEGSGWTELFDVSGGSFMVRETETRTGSTSDQVDWVDVLATGTAFGTGGATACAVEIRAVIGVSDVAPHRFLNTQTGIVITGASFEAAQGTGSVRISPTDNVNDAGAVTQTVTAWADTSITFTAVKGSLPQGTLYLFVTNNSSLSNATGFPVSFIGSASLAWIRA
jgi:hypothetical protein